MKRNLRLRTIGFISAFHCASSFTATPRLAPARPAAATVGLRRRLVHVRATSPAEGSDVRTTDWVIENLEDDGRSITSADPLRAGEGDTLPPEGLAIGNVRIFAAAAAGGEGDGDENGTDDDGRHRVRLLLGRNGWGTGVHPTTRLCLEWIADSISHGDVLLDYGCGSGILSVAALHAGAARCVGVDVEAEALVAAGRNAALNGWDEGRFRGMHTREVLPREACPPSGADVCVANILVGQLVRPSMVAAIVTNVREGGLLCLSGIRPGGEVESLLEAYGDCVEWLDEQYAELSAAETENCLESYGFDCGRWARLVGRKRTVQGDGFIEQMSDLAVS
ncbi:hypothetical protein ACHAWF_017678 [Thalassiosira exigua]